MTSDPKWSPCAPGTLSRICEPDGCSADSWTRRSAAAAMIAALGGGSWWVVQNRNPAELSCAEVSELAPQYITGTLLPKLAQEIDIHRNNCDACNKKLEDLGAPTLRS